MIADTIVINGTEAYVHYKYIELVCTTCICGLMLASIGILIYFVLKKL